MNEYAAPLVDAAPPATIAARVNASAHDITTCMPCSVTPSTIPGVQYDIGMGMDDNEWIGRVFGYVGNVHGPPTDAGHINIVDFPTTPFTSPAVPAMAPTCFVCPH
jgi:hypothetical protein